MFQSRLVFAAALATAVSMPTSASAQGFRSGPTFFIGGTTAPVLLPDVAYDSVNNQWLQVAGSNFIEAHLMNASGTIIRSFVVNQGVGYAQTPRVAFGAGLNGGAGGYLVTWHASVGTLAQVHGRIFSGSGDPLTNDFFVGGGTAPGTSSFWTMGAAVEYSTVSNEFIVAWMGNYGSTNDVFFRRVSPVGALLGTETLVSPGTADWDRDPALGYNRHTDEFYIAYAVYSDAGAYGYIEGRRVKAGTGAFVGSVQIFDAARATMIPSVAYNSANRQFLVTWYHQYTGGRAFYGVVLNGTDGSLVGGLRVMSSYYASYDALDVDYNAPSGEYLLTTHSLTYEDAAVTILPDGNPYDNGFILTNTPDARPVRTNVNSDGNFNPRLATSTVDKKWLMVTASLFTAIHGQFAASNSTGVPPCAVTLSSPSTSANGGGGTGAVGVTAAGCAWTAASNSSWITVTGGASGTGNGSVSFSVAPNNGPARSGGIVIGGQTFAITQTGCSFSLSPPAMSLSAGGGQNLQFNVTASAGCTWTAQPSVNWIATSSSGTGNGTVLFTAVRNASSIVRGGQVSVGGLYFYVFEAGATVNDLTDDGRPDLLFQNLTTGALTSWSMSIGQQVNATGLPQELDLNWRVVGMSDMDRDGAPDVIWRNVSTGAMRVWLMDGTTILPGGERSMTGVAPGNWNVAGTGDFDRDGTPDLVWQDDNNGDVAIWLMKQASDGSFTFKDTRIVANVSRLTWKIRGVADFNRDNLPDLVWQDTSNGAIAVWFMGPSGRSLLDTRMFTYDGRSQFVDPNWRIAAVGDFNNDRRADLVWQHIDGWLAMWLTWDNFVLDTRYLTNLSGTPIRFVNSNLNWKIVGPR